MSKVNNSQDHPFRKRSENFPRPTKAVAPKRRQANKFPHHATRIDLFSTYVLFSHFRPRDITRGNRFFQMSSYVRANVLITNEKNKRKIPLRASRGLKREKMYKLKRSIV